MCDYGGSVTSVLVSMLLLSTVMLQFNICVIVVVLCLNEFNSSCLITLLLYFTTKNSAIKAFSNLVWLSFYMKAEADSGPFSSCKRRIKDNADVSELYYIA